MKVYPSSNLKGTITNLTTNMYIESGDTDKAIESLNTSNLVSKEYSKCIEKYLMPDNRYITITFCEKSGDKLVSKGTYAKMARGEMVRYMAEENIQKPEKLYDFKRMGYHFREDLSSDREYVFERKA